MRVQFGERADRIDLHVRHEGRFGGIAFRHQGAVKALLAGSGSHRQGPTRVVHPVIQREPANDQVIFQAYRADLPGSSQRPERDREIVGGAFLSNQGRFWMTPR